MNDESPDGNAVHVTVAVPNMPPLNIDRVTVSNPDSGSCTVRVTEFDEKLMNPLAAENGTIAVNDLTLPTVGEEVASTRSGSIIWNNNDINYNHNTFL